MSTSAPDTWSGQCSIHHLMLPCPVCTSGVGSKPFIPSEPPYTPQQPYLDPWMPSGVSSPNLTPLPQPPLYGFRFVPSVCDHCFCIHVPAESFAGIHDKPDHEQCCNCGVQWAFSDDH